MTEQDTLDALNHQAELEHREWNEERERRALQILADFRDYIRDYPGFGGPLLASLIIDSELGVRKDDLS